MKKILTLALLALSMMLISCDKEDCMCENNDGQSRLPNNPIDPNNPDTTVTPPITPGDITRSLVGTKWVQESITQIRDHLNDPNIILEEYVSSRIIFTFLDDSTYQRHSEVRESSEEEFQLWRDAKDIPERYEYEYPYITFHHQWNGNGSLMKEEFVQRVAILNKKQFTVGLALGYDGGNTTFTLETP